MSWMQLMALYSLALDIEVQVGQTLRPVARPAGCKE